MTDTAPTPAPKSTSGRWLVLFAALAFGASVTLFNHTGASADDEVRQKGRDAVLLHYIKHANWGPIHCAEGEYEGRDMLYCHPSANTRRGGLYVIRHDGSEPLVLPINGTAMTQTPLGTIEAIDASPVMVRPWDGPLMDIPKAIEALL